MLTSQTEVLQKIKRVLVVCFKTAGSWRRSSGNIWRPPWPSSPAGRSFPRLASADAAGFLLGLWSVAKVGGNPTGGEGSSNKLWETGYRGQREPGEAPKLGPSCGRVCVYKDALGRTSSRQLEWYRSRWASVIRHRKPHRDLINICRSDTWSHMRAIVRRLVSFVWTLQTVNHMNVLHTEWLAFL